MSQTEPVPDQSVSVCACEWKGRTRGPRGWVELIVKRDPDCLVHGDELPVDTGSLTSDEEQR